MTIIIPPPEVRAVADRAAAYVAKNGREFEERLYLENKHNPKFAFINQNDPYHAYFQKKIQDLNQGGTVAIAQTLVEATEMLNKERLIQEKMAPSPIPPNGVPEALEFILNVPFVATLDFDVMKLTSQFAALRGRNFILHLSQREYKNPQFEFLKAGHNLYKAFNKLTDQYQKILNSSSSFLNAPNSSSSSISSPFPSSKGNLGILNRLAEDREQTFDRIKLRSQYLGWLKQQQAHKEELEEMEKKAFASIDWLDYEVVDTIDFGLADKTRELPCPISLEIISQMTLEQKQNLIEENKSGEKIGGLGNDDNERGISISFLDSNGKSTTNRQSIDDDDDEMDVDSSFARKPIKKSSILPLPHPPHISPPPTFPPSHQSLSKIASTFNDGIDGNGRNVGVNIGNNSNQSNSSNNTFNNDILVQCEICRMEFPASQIQEHIRKEMLDEKWIKQKRAHISKHLEGGSNIITSGNEVLENLKRQKF